MSSDAIVVGEEWISEHYFTTDATKESFKARVLARRADWDATKEEGNPRTRFTAARASLLNRLATLDATTNDHASDVRAINADVRAILGYDGIGLTRTVQGPVTFVHGPGLEHTPGLAIIDALPAETSEDLLVKDAYNLAEPFLPPGVHGEQAEAAADHKDAVTSVARLLSLLFVHDDYKPAFAVVLAGPHLLVAERERWPEGRYLAVDLQLVAERNDDKRGGEVDRALTCVSADSLAPDAQGDIWWSATLAESVKHTVGVSKDLREGVRLSIEIIANEVVARRTAQGLDPLPADEAQQLAKQSLRFLYRILFLLYAEASPELGVLPTGAPEYENGYSLDRLRELVLVELPAQRSQAGTHLYESLGALFRLVDQGHDPRPSSVEPVETTGTIDGLTFRSLRADLFKPEATAHIDEVGIGNAALQRVLRHLLLSKEQKGRDRGFISYAELGINQLGAVYEGLMSYTGFFAETDLYEVAKDGNSEKGSWVVPVERAEHIAQKDFVTVEDEHGERKPVLHQQGTFVFRLAGRERQQSASYYTPEVLTRFTVSQALDELLDPDGKRTTAAEILELTICEPALGSGAFAIEAVRQLAEQYLARRQEELGETIDPDAYPRELQRAKAYLALHQVYGVDLNATAVELAEISLWLDTMVEGLEAPWFGLHLRRGNSLIGARKAVYSRAQVEDKSWLKAVPKPVVTGVSSPDEAPSIAGRVPHFLLPAEGWGAAADVGKDIKDLVPEAVAALKTWRKSTLVKPGKKQVDAVVDLGRRVERLWEIASQRLAIAEQQIRRDIPLWNGNDVSVVEEVAQQPSRNQGRHVTREEIEASLADPDGAYRRLKLVMDAWCALWFWPLTETEVEPPTLEQWYDALRMILGADTMSTKVAKKGDDTLQSALTWDELGDVEHNDRVYSAARPVAEVLDRHSWLSVCQRIADREGFFHWELDFATAFRDGGFTLQVGNPPWVKPSFDSDALLAEGDPWFQLVVKPSREAKIERTDLVLRLPGMTDLVVSGATEVAGTLAYCGSVAHYPYTSGSGVDLYRCFMQLVWRNAAPEGKAALIHLESHFTEEGAGRLRRATYRRLKRHWQFINELKLFEIQNQKQFGVNVYGHETAEVSFIMATSLYHPDTAERSLLHDGSGEAPGIKTSSGEWDLRPHGDRIFEVRMADIEAWKELLDPVGDYPAIDSKMFYPVNRAVSAVMAKALSGARLGDIGLHFSQGWMEGSDDKRGLIEVDWGPAESWTSVIYQGSNLFVHNPFNKTPNPTMRNHRDWTEVDLLSLGASAVPTTSFKPSVDMSKYRAAFTHWPVEGKSVSALDTYRVAWRRRAANTGERTLMPSIIPPGCAHVDGVNSALPAGGAKDVPLVCGALGSLVYDFVVRVVPKSDIRGPVLTRLPWSDELLKFRPQIVLRALRLNCLTSAYSDLWEECFDDAFTDDSWARPGLVDELGAVSPQWTSITPLRLPILRHQALLELDVLVAMGLGLSPSELCAIYRTQFPVLRGYDLRTNYFDQRGKAVPTPVLQSWRKKGLDETSVEGLNEEERTHTNASGNTYVYELPFRTLDREADMRQAYAHFEKVLAERTSS